MTRDSQSSNPAIALLIGVLIMAGGGYLYYDGMQATENAETIDATVVSTSVTEQSGSTGTGADNDDGYSVFVRYQYSYEGETYTSTSMCPGAGSACLPSSDSRAEMEEFLEDYPEGETVTAYVSPSNPSNAYLIDKSPSLIYLGVSAFGLVFFLVGVWGFVGGRE
jgi:hypothetical protein